MAEPITSALIKKVYEFGKEVLEIKRYEIPVLLATAILLWNPRRFNASLGLDGLVSEYRWVLGLIGLVLAAKQAVTFIRWLRDWFLERVERRRIKQQLLRFTDAELGLLYYCSARQIETVVVPLTYPEAMSLQQKRCLVVAGGSHNILATNFHIKPWLFSVLLSENSPWKNIPAERLARVKAEAGNFEHRQSQARWLGC